MALKTLQSVDPLSLAKIESVICAIVGFVVFLVLGLIGAHVASLFPLFGAIAGGVIAIVLPLIGIALGLVFGFLVGFIAAIVYNIIAGIIGGVEVFLSTKKKQTSIQGIKPQSYAKIFAVLLLVLGVVISVIIATFVPFGFGATLVVALPIIMFIVGIVFGLIYALVYNLIASKIGGFRIRLDKKGVINWVDPLQYAKIGALFEALYGLVGAFGAAFAGNPSAVGIVGGIIIIPITDAISGFVISYVVGTVYNFVARRIGGIKVELE